MAERPDRDLATLDLQACRARIGADFVRPNADGPPVTLRLVEAEPGRRDPRATGAVDRPFSLVFRGPLDPRLTQGMHDLEHPELTLRGVFLVPAGRDDEGLLYEAVFS